jgi:hypothetical protein
VYARNNPLRYRDPSGRWVDKPESEPQENPIIPGANPLSGLGGCFSGGSIGGDGCAGGGVITIVVIYGVVNGVQVAVAWIGNHVAGQMRNRGWSPGDIQGLISNPTETHKTVDTRRGDPSTYGDPATAYVDSDGNYVVVNDMTGDVIAVSNKNDPGWKAPWDDPNWKEREKLDPEKTVQPDVV